jgi:hypothetical protein
MAHTRRTARKSTGHLPVGQLAPQNVPQRQEFQPDIPQEASPEEEPFKIELVVPKSTTTQDTSVEEQQPPEDRNTEDKTNEEHPPPSDTEDEKMYRDADEVESFRPNLRTSPAGFELCWSTWASPPLPGCNTHFLQE